MIDAYYNILSMIFSPILALPPAISELILAAIICFVITIFYKKMIDQNRALEIKKQIKDFQEKIKTAQKDKQTEEANRLMTQMLNLSSQQMKLMMKPMIPTMLFVILFFPWLSFVYAGKQVLLLPVSLPLFGNDLGWFTWYIIVSIPLTMIFRKIMGVHV